MKEGSRETSLEPMQKARTISPPKFRKKPRNPLRPWRGLAQRNLVYLTPVELAFLAFSLALHNKIILVVTMEQMTMARKETKIVKISSIEVLYIITPVKFFKNKAFCTKKGRHNGVKSVPLCKNIVQSHNE